MHNWWLATLEHFGLLTHEEAEKLSSEINTSVGSERYKDALDNVESIVTNGRFAARKLIPDLEAEVHTLRLKVEELDNRLTAVSEKKSEKKLASPKQT